MTTVTTLLTDAAPADPVQTATETLEAQAEGQARVVAAYFNGLRSRGVPLELCEHLTKEWHAWKHDVKFWLMPAAKVEA